MEEKIKISQFFTEPNSVDISINFGMIVYSKNTSSLCIPVKVLKFDNKFLKTTAFDIIMPANTRIYNFANIMLKHCFLTKS